MSMSIGRGPWRGPPNILPSSTSIALQTSSSSSGSSAVEIRAAALRKSGWSRISPTGSVSYSPDTASTSTPCAASAAIAARMFASRSPTFEPRLR